MKFGPVAVEDAVGCVLGHALSGADKRYKKGHLLTTADVQDIAGGGHEHIIVAKLDPGDIGEDAAASRLARALLEAGSTFITAAPAFTGRVNFHAENAGLFEADRSLVDQINAVDPAITLATLPSETFVEAGRMVATVKIIPFAVPSSDLARAEQVVQSSPRSAIAVHRPVVRSVAHISTKLPTLKGSVMDKTRSTFRARLERLGAHVLDEVRVEHSVDSVTEALRTVSQAANLIVLFGASAITDPDDILPTALRAAGGHVERVGMPVDPGNLIMVGHLEGKPVIGAPGCARSPAENGFDWVLQRLCCGLPVDNALIASWGVGGLLMEIVSRPQPRETEPAIVSNTAQNGAQ